MSKKIIILLCAFIAAVNAQSQIKYGLLVGGEFTRPTGNLKVEGGNGFVGGLQLEYNMPASGLAFGTAVNYQRRTIGDDIKPGGDFLSVPVSVKYKFPLRALKELAGPILLTGPDFAWRLGDGFGKVFHFGWNAGIGFDIINFIQLSAGYRVGLNNISTTPTTVHDSGWFVNASLLFDF